MEGVPFYYMGYDEITDEHLRQMQQQATDYLEARYAEIHDQVSHTDFVYEGAYFMTPKDNAGWIMYYNMLYLVYSAEVTSLEDNFEPTKVYLPVSFDTLCSTNGALSYNGGKSIEGRTDLKVKYSVLLGYTDGVKMYNELAVTQKANYAIEVTGNLTGFGQN